MIDKKVVQFVDRCVAKEYQRHKKKYDMYGIGEFGAAVKVYENFSKAVFDENFVEKYKNNETKGHFVLSAYDYCDRLAEWYKTDAFWKNVRPKNYYANKVWEAKSWEDKG